MLSGAFEMSTQSEPPADPSEQQSDSVSQGLPARAGREHARRRHTLRATSRSPVLRQRSGFVPVRARCWPSPASELTAEIRRTCAVTSTSLLGSSVAIGASSTITRSVLSSSVSIGANCRIVNSYLFAGAVVGDDCEIRDSVLGEGARVESGSKVGSGSLVAAGAVLGNGTKLVARRVSLEEPAETEPSEGIRGSLSPSVTRLS